MNSDSIEISFKGKWSKVPAVKVGDKYVVSKGRLLRTASVHAEQWLTTSIDSPEEFIQALQGYSDGGRKADIFTFAEMLPRTEPRFPYYWEGESTAAIQISTFDAWWDDLPQETRKNVRRSQKRGVYVVVKKLDEELIDQIVALNNDSPLRQGKAYTHFGKTREQVVKDQQDFLDHSDYICAYHEDELVGVAKLIYRGESASILTFVPKSSHNDKRPANALIAKIVEVCVEKRLKYLVYGMYNYYNKKETSLRAFKERTGFREVLVPRYYVPLTLRGRLGIRLRLHRGLIGILPHNVIMMLVNLRTKVNQIKSRQAGVAQRQSGRIVIDRWGV